MDNLGRKTVIGSVQIFIGMGALLFVPAGTFSYWQAWVFLFVFIASALLITAYLWKHDKALLARRMSAGPAAEKEKTQKIIMSFAVLGFIALAIVPALDHRFAWSRAPAWLVIAGDALMALGFYIIFRVFKENTFTAATVEIHKDQKVISTGPYAQVRHPMYFGGLLLLIGTPIALGSYWGILVFIPFLPILIWRLLDEEKFLSKNLPGYPEYQKKATHRLVPFVW